MFQLKNGTRCRFKLSDVICPDKQQVVAQITADLEVSGEIVLFSDAGNEPEQFAIIEVGGIAAPLIVPVARLQVVKDADPQPPQEKPAHIDSRYEKVGQER